MKKFTAGANEDGVRLSRFVEGVTSGLPRSLLYKSFRNASRSTAGAPSRTQGWRRAM